MLNGQTSESYRMFRVYDIAIVGITKKPNNGRSHCSGKIFPKCFIYQLFCGHIAQLLFATLHESTAVFERQNE